MKEYVKLKTNSMKRYVRSTKTRRRRTRRHLRKYLRQSGWLGLKIIRRLRYNKLYSIALMM